jgi:hypothetical protein
VALRCVGDTKLLLRPPKEKSRLAAGLSFSLTVSLNSFELAVALALLALAALAVGILLLLPGLLAAALLLAGLLTRVLILLARVLVLVGHSRSPYLRCSKCNGTNGEGQLRFPKNFDPRAIIAWRRFVLSVAVEPAKLPVYSRLSRTPRCCRSRFPLLKNDLRRGVPAAGGHRGVTARVFRKSGNRFATRIRANHKHGSAWIIWPSN